MKLLDLVNSSYPSHSHAGHRHFHSSSSYPVAVTQASTLRRSHSAGSLSLPVGSAACQYRSLVFAHILKSSPNTFGFPLLVLHPSRECHGPSSARANMDIEWSLLLSSMPDDDPSCDDPSFDIDESSLDLEDTEESLSSWELLNMNLDMGSRSW